jgi:small-conductance mechanosensitive channel
VQPTATGLLDEIVSTREPVPTATPGRIAEEVSEITTSLGLAGEEYLGLSADDWINLWISVLTSLFVFFGGTWLIGHALPRAARRTPTGFDDRFLEAIGPQLRWLVVLVTLYFATKRLVFVSADLKLLLIDLYFVLALVLGVQMVWKLIDLADRVYRERLAREGRKDELAPIITLLVRLSQVVVAVAGISILLSHFGIHITALAAALGLSSLAISLAARDTIADAISGFVILVDRPFRIGDRIEIQEVGTWGDVMDIGLRTTRIRTRDNRMVIVPNSIIGTNQVVNYTYPDPRYRVETHVSIAYGTDIEMARRIIIDAMGQVEGVLPDRPVDALYVEMGDSAMVFRVRWWIESYEDMRRMFDKVHTALQHAFDEERLESPYPTQSVNVRIGPGMSHPSEALVGHDGATQARGTTEG